MAGLAIEPRPDIAQAFARERPRDTFINADIDSKPSSLRYYIYAEQALNTFSTERVAELKSQNCLPTNEVTVQCLTLDEVLRRHAPQNGVIDLISIDTEGFEMNVLHSFDIAKWKPRLLLVEDHASDIMSASSSDVARYLTDHGYIIQCRFPRSSLFVLPG